MGAKRTLSSLKAGIATPKCGSSIAQGYRVEAPTLAD
jgi:hypothetical protein